MIHRIFYILTFTISSSVFFSCESTEPKEVRLAKNYCGSCHLYPDPSLLDKKTWKHSVLPQMAFRMGIDQKMLWELPQQDLSKVVTTLPKKPMITESEWVLIRDYFIEKSPDTLRYIQPQLNDTLQQFHPRPIPLSSSLVTTIVRDTSNHNFYVGTEEPKIYRFDNTLNATDSIFLSSPVSHIKFGNNGELLMTMMGNMHPNDQESGSIANVDLKEQRTRNIISKLQRPVYFEYTDLNNDGAKDMLVCSFGNFAGALQLYSQDEDGFSLKNLNSNPGARKVVVRDFNGDGLKDIVALMAQGDEKLILYINKGNFLFEEKELKRFPPVYGSNYFELYDFNKDGYDDILYTNGDNADFSPVLKPYHGVRILINDGKNNFQEKWSFAMAGVCQAMAEDFDKDGDLDIAAISFFPDFKKHPEHGFIYFENLGKFNFKPYVTPMAGQGRWLVMETGDFDLDDDIDIVLGAFNSTGLGAGQEATKKWDNRNPILFLENKLHKSRIISVIQ